MAMAGPGCFSQLLRLLLLAFFKFVACSESIDKIAPMKICIYSHSLPPEVDGVGRRFELLIGELKKQGHEVFVFTLEKKVNFPGLRVVHMLSHARVPTYPTKKIAAPNPADLWSTVDILRREKPDIIHAVVDGVTTQFIMAARIVGIPVVGSIHTDVQRIIESTIGKHSELGSAFMRKIVSHKEAKDAQQLDKCGTTSKSFREKIGKQGILCPFIVPTSVNVDVFKPTYSKELRNELTFGNPDAFLVVYVGRLAPEKGIEQLIEWVSKDDSTYLALMGDGPMNITLKAKHGNHTRIYCQPGMKPHAELAKIYSTANVHVSASIFETLGNTVLESQACGTPVIVPYTQGFKDTILHEVDGFLYPPDQPDKATAYLKTLKEDAALMKRFSDSGRGKIFANYTVKQTALTIARWYRETVDNWEPKTSIFHDLELIAYTIAPYPIWFCYDCVHMSSSTLTQIIACLVILALHKGLKDETYLGKKFQQYKMTFLQTWFDENEIAETSANDYLGESIYHIG